MKRLAFLLILSLTHIMAFSCANNDNASEEPPVKGEGAIVPLGDPFIMLHNNKYYAYGTHSDSGIEVYISDDLKIWEKQPRLALSKEDSYADRWFWAPEIYYIKEKKKFFMYYSADEHICVAESDSPLGPFKQTVKKPMLDGQAIDNSLFIDNDGTPYMTFVRFVDGEGVPGNSIWTVKLEGDLETVQPNTLIPSLQVTEAWENIWPRVVEAPFIVKHKDKYYMSYSANSYESPFYGVGYATADSPMGPWTKYEKNPILQKPSGLQGVGHSAMFTDKDGNLKIVFHAHYSAASIHPRGMYIMDVKFTNDDIPVMTIEGEITECRLKN